MSGCRKCREAAFSNWARELHLGIIGWGVVIYSSCSSLICCYISNLCDIGAARRSTLLTIFFVEVPLGRAPCIDRREYKEDNSPGCFAEFY